MRGGRMSFGPLRERAQRMRPVCLRCFSSIPQPLRRDQGWFAVVEAHGGHLTASAEPRFVQQWLRDQGILDGTAPATRRIWVCR
jgi:hypothetical protein